MTYIEERPPAGGQVNVNSAAPVVQPAWSARRVINLIFGIVLSLLLLRVVLLLLGANDTNSIVAGIMAVSTPLVAPFWGMFDIDAISANGQSVLDLAALVAMIGWFLVQLLALAVAMLFARRSA